MISPDPFPDPPVGVLVRMVTTEGSVDWATDVVTHDPPWPVGRMICVVPSGVVSGTTSQAMTAATRAPMTNRMIPARHESRGSEVSRVRAGGEEPDSSFMGALSLPSRAAGGRL